MSCISICRISAKMAICFESLPVCYWSPEMSLIWFILLSLNCFHLCLWSVQRYGGIYPPFRLQLWSLWHFGHFYFTTYTVHPMNQNAAFRPAISAHNPGPAVPILHQRIAVRAAAAAAGEEYSYSGKPSLSDAQKWRTLWPGSGSQNWTSMDYGENGPIFL